MQTLTVVSLEHLALLPAVLLLVLALVVLLLRWRPLPLGRRILRWTTVVALGLLALAAAAGSYFTFTIHRVLEQRVAQLSFQLLADGSVHRVHDYTGNVVVVNYWATWCPPCRKEMPALSRLADAYRGRGVIVVTVSDEPKPRLVQYTRAHDLHTLSGTFRDQPPTGVIAQIAYQGRPATFVLDRQGHLRRFLVGSKTFADFEDLVREAL
jgi:thiol-disulfide isomerase/thioredoxin